MIAAVTGRRNIIRPDRKPLADKVATILKENNVKHLLQGQAVGADLCAAAGAFAAGVPFTSVVPWQGHRNSISKEWLPLYDWVIGRAAKEVVINPSLGYPGAYAYHARNDYMIARCDLLIAVWDGKKNGGTYSTMSKAQARGIPVIVVPLS